MLVNDNAVHMQAIADRDIGYENIMQQSEQQLQGLAESMGIAEKVLFP